MHRSGTSCLAGSLENAGVHLGDVVQRSPHNLKGNRESKPLRAINDDLLAFNGGSWDKIPAKLHWDAGLRARRDAHIAEFQDIPVWGFKDPRCLLTIPFWREALPHMCLVATFRHPASVIQSLSERSGLSPATPPLRLWYDYNSILVELCRAETVPLVCFDWPDEVYRERLGHLAETLGLSAGKAKDGFFEDALRRSKPTWPAGSKQQDRRLLKQAEELYQTLLGLTRNV